MKESKDMPIYNPFIDDNVDCYCEFELSKEDRSIGTHFSAELVVAETEDGVNLMPYILIEDRARIEDDFEVWYQSDFGHE